MAALTKEVKAENLTRHFKTAREIYGNPRGHGHSPSSYAKLVANRMRELIAEREPTEMTTAEAMEFADELDRGDYDQLFAGLMGYC